MNGWRVWIPLSIFLILACFSAQAQCACTDCQCSDSLELVKLYNSTNGAGWTVRDTLGTRSPWVLSQPMTTWYGITLTNGRVTEISLSTNQLSGNIPNFNLPNLNVLTLERNQLNGSIPNFNLPKLRYLGLFINQLNGSIPNFNLPNLNDLDLRYNQLDSSIPNLNLPNLKVLALNNNQLSSNIPNFNLPNLKYLSINYNQLNGCIPKEIKTNCPLILPTGGNISNNPNLATQSWANYWNNGEGACIPCASMTNSMNITGGNVCQGGTALLAAGTNAVAPTYLWSTGETTANISITRAGTYSVTISQSDGCTKTTSITAGACAVVDTTTCRYKDSTALAALYRATNMQNIPPQYKWDLSKPMITWYGVTLNANGCVECLDLDGGVVDCGILDPNPSGIGLVGTLPDSMRLLTSLTRLVLQGNTGLSGFLPPNFGSMTSLKHFYAYNCRFTTPFPTSFWALPNIEGIDLNDNPLNTAFPTQFGNFRKLKELHLCTTGLTGTIPQNLGTLDSLGNLDICDNQLTGSVPTNLTTRPKLQVFQIEKNKLDVSPNFSALPFSAFEPRWIPFFSVRNNGFTFDDIVPNMPIINRISATYTPQDSIFTETTYTKTVGTPLSINLNIDGALTTNSYKWFKNGAPFRIPTNSNTLIFNNLQATDAGVYTCEVTNPNAPLLTLYSRKITLIVNPALVDITSCRYRDSLALITFFNSTNGPNWTIRDRIIDGERKVSPWNFSLPLDNWHGVYLNNFGCVHQMNLFDNNVGDTLPSGIDSLSNLTLLLLSKNKIGGKIPERLGNMTKITHLDFSFNQLTDTIPQSMGNLRDLELCYLGGNNALTGKIPTSYGNFTKIKELMFNECDLVGTIPSELGNLVNVQKLLMDHNRLSGTVPTSLSNLRQIKSLQFGNNQLIGAIPTTFRNLNQLVCLGFENNQIDSLPDLSNIVSLDTGCLQAQINRLTFDDIVPNRRSNNRFNYSYNPQDSIFKDTTITAAANTPLSINLNIDGAITDNNYKWFKNGIEIPSLFSQKNTLILRGVLPCDAGIYTCQVTNNRAPQLTLYSRKIRLIVNPILAQTRNKTICAGQKDTLPSGRIVAPTITTVFNDTIKNRSGCDSLIYIITITPTNNATTSNLNPNICNGQSYTLPNGQIVTPSVTTTYRDTLKNRTGCDSLIRIITVTPTNNATTTNLNPNICSGQNYTLPNGQIVTPSLTTTYRDTLKNRTGCDSLIRITKLTVSITLIEAFDDKLELNVGDSATINLLLNDKLGGQNGRITLLNTPTEGITKRLNDSQIRYTAPNILRGPIQTLKYKVCLIDCPSNCDSAILRITIEDNNAYTGRIKNGVAPQISGEEYFEIDSIQAFEKAQLFIYNNWNELVFKSAIPYDNRWKGTGQNDAPLPSGVYYYVLRHAAPNRKYLEGKILLLHD